jgi:hypothetical protein
MKHLYYLAPLLLLAACRQQDPMTFSGDARVQLNDTVTIRRTFVYSPETVTRDTVLVRVNTIGETSDRDRLVALVQETEYVLDIVTDPVTGLPDTSRVERPLAAIPGTHYVAFDDPSVTSLAVVRAGAVTADLPVILLRDPSLKSADYRLRVRLDESADFKTGEKNATAILLVISDRLVQPSFWDINVNYSFGTYNTRKHQFMIDASGERIDNEWYDARVRNIVGALQQYKNFFKAALNAFNNDPANIAAGIAPLRETDDPASPLVSFPN